jgi:hypothetical protein
MPRFQTGTGKFGRPAFVVAAQKQDPDRGVGALRNARIGFVLKKQEVCPQRPPYQAMNQPARLPSGVVDGIVIFGPFSPF